MKLEKLRLKNFGLFEDFEIVFNDGITNLVGINGSGKTTVGLTALWAGFRGIAEKGQTGALPGQRFRFITSGKKSLDVEITLADEKTGQKLLLKRHITKSTNTIKIEPLYTDKPGMSREDVESLFNVAFLSASHFSALTGKEQAAAMGMDTTSFDKDLKDKKEHAAGYRRDIKAIGELVPVEECTKKDINVLYDNQKKATEHNTAQAKATGELSIWRDRIEDLDRDIDAEIEVFEAYKVKHEEKVAAMNEDRITASTTVKEFPPINDPIDLEPIELEIKAIVESNHKFFLYETYRGKLAELGLFNEHLSENLVEQKEIQDDRAKYLQSKSFGIKGLQIDEDGNLTKDGKLIRGPYFSKGELEVLVARIGMNLNPELKVRFIDNFELLDDDNQEKLITHLTKKGFQIITATVGKKIVNDHSVLLRECKVAGGKVIEATENVTTNPEPDVDSWDEPDTVGAEGYDDMKPEDKRQETFDGTTKPEVIDDDEF